MKQLRFSVSETELKAQEAYTGIMRGSHRYLQLVFSFGRDWKDYRRVVQVKDVDGNEYNDIITNDGVVLPREITQTSRLYNKVYGRKGEETIQTNVVTIEQL